MGFKKLCFYFTLLLYTFCHLFRKILQLYLNKNLRIKNIYIYDSFSKKKFVKNKIPSKNQQPNKKFSQGPSHQEISGRLKSVKLRHKCTKTHQSKGHESWSIKVCRLRSVVHQSKAHDPSKKLGPWYINGTKSINEILSEPMTYQRDKRPACL